MGIYQVTPGEDYWQTTSNPYFENVKVTKEDGRKVFVSLPYDRIGFLNQEGRETVKKEQFKSIIPVPVIIADTKSFKEKLPIQFKSWNKNAKIFYSVNNKPFILLSSGVFTIKELV